MSTGTGRDTQMSMMDLIGILRKAFEKFPATAGGGRFQPPCARVAFSGRWVSVASAGKTPPQPFLRLYAGKNNTAERKADQQIRCR